MSEQLPQFVLPKDESYKMFNTIAPRYDLLNRLLSFGLDISWRNKMVQFLSPNPSQKVLDLATGTADVAIALAQHNSHIKHITGIDPAEKMLAIGRDKVDQKGLADTIDLQVGDAQQLTFEDNTFDVITISFGIRNVADLRLGLMEMYRVLKSEGRLIILEFSMPSNPVMRLGHIIYLRYIVPLVGFIFSGNYKAYKYLNQTIEDFPYGDQFCRIIQQMGFRHVKQHPLLFGVASIYVAEK